MPNDTCCWFCRAPMNWNADFNYEDYGLEGDGVIAVLSCTKCEATATFYSEPPNE